ncbi:hypothetical protein BH23ACT1_BH23ACT1_11530 [soil metagenome]
MAVIERLRRLTPESKISGAIVAAAVVFTLVALQPMLLVADTLPAGGDMGAHVWGPAFLRDHLLSEGRLSGWAPDWYAGFPAYHFYMVIPSLAIVALDLLLPYGVAFKLVTVSGLLALPVAAWAFGRLARLPFPGPPLLAVGAVGFVFDRSFTIYGGNAASTLAGEFAFSISLALAVLFLGLVLQGLETGRLRVAAAITLALCALCHIIPAMFAIAGATLAMALRMDRGRLRWLASAGVVGGLLTCFWTVPFILRRAYLNDMGWEKLTTYWESLLPGRLGASLTRAFGGEATATIAGDITWVAVLAIVGLGTSIIFRRRLGMFLGLLSLLFAVAFVLVPQGRLWNARLLPFWYLCLYLLAAIAVAEFARSAAVLLSERADEPRRAALWGVPVAATLVALVAIGLPLRTLPFGSLEADGSYSWLSLSTADRSFIPDWARWNYSGYERKDAYPEFRAVVDTMDDVGERLGCGRAMWEYETARLDRYGTPMALMLLPQFTDGCIGSMAGLFFEASTTTPYHFLNQSELSASPSRAQRDLPYGPLDVERGVEHLQLLGVRYYMAFSPEAVAQAQTVSELTEVASVEGWHVYEVADTELVAPLDAEPVVLEGVAKGGQEWLDVAVDWYMDPAAQDVFLAADGPSSWARMPPEGRPEEQPVAPVEVSDINAGTDSISFRVDRPGTPVLVKTSYFPNWQASGADGPWRVAPNLMVVVPTTNEVELRYGTTPIDVMGWALSLLGMAGLAGLVVKGPVAFSDRRRRTVKTDGTTPALVLDGLDEPEGEGMPDRQDETAQPVSAGAGPGGRSEDGAKSSS